MAVSEKLRIHVQLLFIKMIETNEKNKYYKLQNNVQTNKATYNYKT